jgi:multiple antibiotic resistance protein
VWDAVLRIGATIFLVVDPLGFVPVFLAVTPTASPGERRRIIRRAVLLAFGVGAFVTLAGHPVLRYLGISLPAFTIAGGALLLMMAVEMLFGHRALVQAPVRGEAGQMDVAVFPLAVPMLTGPGTIAAIFLFLSLPSHPPWVQVWILLALALSLGTCWLLVHLSEPLLRWLGEGGIQVLTRLMGILLAGLAVQFVLTGIREYALELKRVWSR